MDKTNIWLLGCVIVVNMLVVVALSLIILPEPLKFQDSGKDIILFAIESIAISLVLQSVVIFRIWRNRSEMKLNMP